jgi:SAM-dependent methyltransferase
LVVGCGRGHEALLLARVGAEGSQVVGIDLAPAAVRIAQGLADEAGLSSRLSYQVQDLFAWPQSDPSQCGRYDLVVEHNCFCAIESEHRPQYVEAVSRLLRPGGRLVGLFYTHNYPGGPPYATSTEEIRSRLLPAFDITHEEVPTDSAITRAGLELLLVAVRR